jgi:hypothetical protein
MNPNNPSNNELRHIERLFLEQMQRLSTKTTNPKLAELGWLQSFDLQFSDRWITGGAY